MIAARPSRVRRLVVSAVLPVASGATATTSHQNVPPSHAKISPDSRPDVAKSQNDGSPATSRAPTGNSVRRVQNVAPTLSVPGATADAISLDEAAIAAARPNTEAASASQSAMYSRRIACGRTNLAIVRTAIHSGLVKASTRSPALKTGPLPWVICCTTRRLMKPSSEVQRRCQARAAKIGTGAHFTTAAAEIHAGEMSLRLSPAATGRSVPLWTVVDITPRSGCGRPAPGTLRKAAQG